MIVSIDADAFVNKNIFHFMGEFLLDELKYAVFYIHALVILFCFFSTAAPSVFTWRTASTTKDRLAIFTHDYGCIKYISCRLIAFFCAGGAACLFCMTTSKAVDGADPAKCTKVVNELMTGNSRNCSAPKGERTNLSLVFS